MRFDTGDPAVVEQPRHRGTVILVATSADIGWTTWPLHKSYLPVMQQIVMRCLGRPVCRAEHPGRPAVRSVVSSRRAPVRRSRSCRPRGSRLDQAAGGRGASASSISSRPILAGQYQVKIGPPLSRESSFAANPDPAESDLTKLDRAGLAEQIPGWNFLYLTNSRELAAGCRARWAVAASCTSRCFTGSWRCCSSNRFWRGDSGTMMRRREVGGM